MDKCIECQRVKVEHRHLTSFLQPNDIPQSKWEVISMDFIVGVVANGKEERLDFRGS
jgi:hypothetical protein